MDRQEAIQIIKNNWPNGRHMLSEALEFLIPELKESEDEKMKREILELVSISGNGNQYEEIKDWLEKQGEQNPAKLVTVVERDGEQWVRVCAFGEDFIIAANDYKDGDKTEFTWGEACKIGTFNKKQGYIMLALLDEINSRLEEIGGKPLASTYWSSSEYSQGSAWYVNFNNGYVGNYTKYGSTIARAVAAF